MKKTFLGFIMAVALLVPATSSAAPPDMDVENKTNIIGFYALDGHGGKYAGLGLGIDLFGPGIRSFATVSMDLNDNDAFFIGVGFDMKIVDAGKLSVSLFGGAKGFNLEQTRWESGSTGWLFGVGGTVRF